MNTKFADSQIKTMTSRGDIFFERMFIFFYGLHLAQHQARFLICHILMCIKFSDNQIDWYSLTFLPSLVIGRSKLRLPNRIKNFALYKSLFNPIGSIEQPRWIPNLVTIEWKLWLLEGIKNSALWKSLSAPMGFTRTLILLDIHAYQVCCQSTTNYDF